MLASTSFATVQGLVEDTLTLFGLTYLLSIGLVVQECMHGSLGFSKFKFKFSSFNDVVHCKRIYAKWLND